MTASPEWIHRSRVGRNTVIYAFAQGAGHLYLLISIPLLTAVLRADQWGFYTILVQVVGVIQIAAIGFFSQALLKFYVDYEGVERQRFVGTVGVSVLVLGLAIVALLYPIGSRLLIALFPNITFDPSPFLPATAAWALLTPFRSLGLTLLKIRERPGLLMGSQLLYGIVLLPAFFFFCVVRGGALTGALTAVLLAEAATVALLLWINRREFRLAWAFSHVRRSVIFTAPLFLSSLLFIFYQNVDRIILARYTDLAGQGVYGVGLMVGQTVALVVTAFVSSYTPRMLKVIRYEGLESARRLGRSLLEDNFYLVGGAVAALAVVSPFLVQLLARQQGFETAVLVALGIALGHFFRSIYLFFQNGLFYSGHTGRILVLNLCLAVTSVCLAYLGGAVAGGVGIAFLKGGAYLVFLPLALLWTARLFPVSFPTRAVVRVGGALLLVVGLAVVGWYADTGRPRGWALEVFLAQVAVVAVVFQGPLARLAGTMKR